MNRLRNTSGFSLVETALALLVVGVGMIAILGLMPLGLDSNKKSIDDTRMGLFADYVMNAIRCKAENGQGEWDQIKDTGTLTLLPPTWDTTGGNFMWENVPGHNYNVVPGPAANGKEVSYYVKGSSPDIEEMSFRYELRIRDVSSRVKSITLEVWPGAGIRVDTHKFYTEIYRYDSKS